MRETGWVIETARTEYWEGRQPDAFSPSHEQAMRFARFEDAERARIYLVDKKIGPHCRSVEHLWIGDLLKAKDTP